MSRGRLRVGAVRHRAHSNLLRFGLKILPRHFRYRCASSGIRHQSGPNPGTAPRSQVTSRLAGLVNLSKSGPPFLRSRRAALPYGLSQWPSGRVALSFDVVLALVGPY